MAAWHAKACGWPRMSPAWDGCRFYRIGLPIMAVHDLSDPFMEIAKVFNYCKAKVRIRPGG